MELTQGMFIVKGHMKDKGDFGQLWLSLCEVLHGDNNYNCFYNYEQYKWPIASN
jgi:hypothetical protein